MDSPKPHSLTSLVIFQNTLNEELIKSLHVYRLDDDGKMEKIERDFVLSKASCYVEMVARCEPELWRVQVSVLLEGLVIGVWVCRLVFDADHPTRLVHIPSILSISRNPKLGSIPTLANDLQMICLFSSTVEDKEPSQSQSPTKEMCEPNTYNNDSSEGTLLLLDQDLNSPSKPVKDASYTKEEDQQNDQTQPGVVVKEKKRAASDRIARIDLSDLVKYFDLPIIEASKNLNVGLTVLKRKCREFGIPRWPHRKIKSLDTLIRDLQEESERQKREDEAAATAVAKRQRMLESEKQTIESKPFIEIQSETKRFRQDVFKRRHRARALKNHSISTTNHSISTT